ncbi:MAG: nicotinate-nucleotide--dimethylbenzimidazole phosphoribosyltransferase [Arcobacteraceae bacterium]
MTNIKIKDLVKNIKPVNKEIEKEVLKKFDNLTKPRKSLGLLENLIARAAGIYATAKPDLSRKVIFLMAADHGVTAEKVSAYPSEITRQMILNFLNGGAAINVLTRHFGIEVIITDMGIRGDITDIKGLFNKKLNHGTKNMAVGPAMSRETAEQSIIHGYEVFEQAYTEKEIGLIGLGEMGIGNTTASSAVISVLTGEKVEKVVDKGTGLKPEEVLHKISIIKKAIEINRPNPDDAIDVLAKVGGFEIGGLVGCILAAAAKRIPVVMDGLISGACSLLAVNIAPIVEDYLFASHCSKEKGHKVALSNLRKRPIFDLEMHLGEGTGAVYGMNFIETGFKLLNQMATFDDLIES